jgi:holliday junction DNA helicase RuvA
MLAGVIGWLSGIVVERELQGLILDVNGVGYEIAIMAELLGARVAAGEELALWIHSHATSESPTATLYGFVTSEQRKIFRLLLKVKGIGPRLAQAIVGRMGGEGVAEAVRSADVARLTTVPGVGKKTAQQIILDLAGQLSALESAAPQPTGELATVASALTNLGFRRPQVDRALRVLREREQTEGSIDEVIRRALALLREM